MRNPFTYFRRRREKRLAEIIAAMDEQERRNQETLAHIQKYGAAGLLGQQRQPTQDELAALRKRMAEMEAKHA